MVEDDTAGIVVHGAHSHHGSEADLAIGHGHIVSSGNHHAVGHARVRICEHGTVAADPDATAVEHAGLVRIVHLAGCVHMLHRGTLGSGSAHIRDVPEAAALVGCDVHAAVVVAPLAVVFCKRSNGCTMELLSGTQLIGAQEVVARVALAVAAASVPSPEGQVVALTAGGEAGHVGSHLFAFEEDAARQAVEYVLVGEDRRPGVEVLGIHLHDGAVAHTTHTTYEQTSVGSEVNGLRVIYGIFAIHLQSGASVSILAQDETTSEARCAVGSQDLLELRVESIDTGGLAVAVVDHAGTRTALLGLGHVECTEGRALHVVVVSHAAHGVRHVLATLRRSLHLRILLHADRGHLDVEGDFSACSAQIAVGHFYGMTALGQVVAGQFLGIYLGLACIEVDLGSACGRVQRVLHGHLVIVAVRVYAVSIGIQLDDGLLIGELAGIAVEHVAREESGHGVRSKVLEPDGILARGTIQAPCERTALKCLGVHVRHVGLREYGALVIGQQGIASR